MLDLAEPILFSPTNLLRISGPLTIFGSLPFSILPIWRAMSVLPVPGGPYSSTPCGPPTPPQTTFRCWPALQISASEIELSITTGQSH